MHVRLCVGYRSGIDWCLLSVSCPSYVHGILVQIRSISTLAPSLELGVIFAWAVPNQMYRRITMETVFDVQSKLQRGTKNLKQNSWQKNTIPGLNRETWLGK